MKLNTTVTGSANAGGSLAVRLNADLRLIGGPLHVEGTRAVSSSGASLTGTIRGAGPLYTSYITGNFDLSTQMGVSASAAVFGLTHSPGGLTIGASFFQYRQGSLSYISGGLMPDLSERIFTNLRVGFTAQGRF